MTLSVPNPLEAKNLEIYGAGFGLLTYNSDNRSAPIELVSNFNDSGQPALGQATDIMTINDRYPRCIVPPMSIGSGTISFDMYGLRTEGVWGTIFNGRFTNAKTLVDLFTKQFEQGAIKLFWITTDANGVPTKVLQYDGVVVTSATRQVRVSNRGEQVATQTIQCKYTLCREKTTRNN